MVDLSEQELIDCDHLVGADGCDGGNMINAYQWVLRNGGIATERDYSYKGMDGDCNVELLNYKNVTISGYQDVPRGQNNLIKSISLQVKYFLFKIINNLKSQ